MTMTWQKLLGWGACVALLAACGESSSSGTTIGAGGAGGSGNTGGGGSGDVGSAGGNGGNGGIPTSDTSAGNVTTGEAGGGGDGGSAGPDGSGGSTTTGGGSGGSTTTGGGSGGLGGSGDTTTTGGGSGGSGGSTTTGGGSGGTGSVECLRDEDASGYPATCETTEADSCCTRCVAAKCCEAFSECYATYPENICGGSGSDDSEMRALVECMVNIEDGSSPGLEEGADFDNCILEARDTVSDPICGNGSVSGPTNELAVCIHGDQDGLDGCFVECFTDFQDECTY